MLPSRWTMLLTETAFAKVSGRTIAGSRACRAGPSKEEANPMRMTRPKMSSSWTQPPAVASASTSAQVNGTTLADAITRRRSNVSATTPPIKLVASAAPNRARAR